MKKSIIFIISAAILVFMVLGSCSQKDSPSGPSENPDEPADTATNTPVILSYTPTFTMTGTVEVFTQTSTNTPVISPTFTEIINPPTHTATSTDTGTYTLTPTGTPTFTETRTHTITETGTHTTTITPTATQTPALDIYEPDNNYLSASSISSGETQTHIIDPGNERDWVHFTVNARSEVTIETDGASGDTRMFLYDSSDPGTSIYAFDDYGGDPFAKAYVILDPEYYYVEVFSKNDEIINPYTIYLEINEITPTYTPSVTPTVTPTATPTFTQTPYIDIYEPDDSRDTASVIENNSPQEHGINPSSDHDWMTFDIGADSAFNLIAENNNADTLHVRLWKGTSAVLEEMFVSNGSGEITRNLVPETYYIQCRSTDGAIIPYTIEINAAVFTATVTETVTQTATKTVTPTLTATKTVTRTITPTYTNTPYWESVGSANTGCSDAEHVKLVMNTSDPAYCYVCGTDDNVREFNGVSWDALSDPAGSFGVDWMSMAIDSSGAYFAAYADGTSTDTLTIREYTGSSWNLLDDYNQSSGIPSYVDIEVNPVNDEPYVAYVDGGSFDRGYVKRWDGSSFYYVPHGMNSYMDSDEGISLLDMEMHDYTGAPYIAYKDSSGDLVVKYHDGTGWVPVGGTDPVAIGVGDYISLVVYGTKSKTHVYVLWQDNSGNLWIDYYTGSWSVISGLGSGSHPSIALDSLGGVYVAYWDSANSELVPKYYTGIEWQDLAGASLSSGTATEIDLVAKGGYLHLIYQDSADNGIYVEKYPY